MFNEKVVEKNRKKFQTFLRTVSEQGEGKGRSFKEIVPPTTEKYKKSLEVAIKLCSKYKRQILSDPLSQNFKHQLENL